MIAATIPTMMRGGRITLLALAMTALCIACAAPRASKGDFDSPDPAAKLYAINRAGNHRDDRAVKNLIEQLDNDDPAVRMMSINALHRITGARLDYNPYATPAARRPAIDRWVQFVENGQIELPKSQQAGTRN